MKTVRRQGGKAGLSSFDGLSEEEVRFLYSVAKIRKLQPGEVLIREGETDQLVYVILDGVVEILKNVQGSTKRIAVLRRDDWIGEIAFTRKIPRTASAVAGGDVTVMVIDEATLSALEDRTQLFFYRRLNDLAYDRISRLEADRNDLSDRNRQLMEGMFASRSGAGSDYETSDLIKGIIKKVPKLPVFASSLAVKLLEDRISAKEVADLVKEDPALVAMVLKVVNSPYYGFQSQVTDIHHAVVLLGFNALQQLVVGEGIRRTLPDTPAYRDLHFHSMALSSIAFGLCSASKIGKPAQIATIGLLHDLGRGVIHLLREQNPNLSILINRLESTAIGSLLLKAWNLPEIVWRTVEFQDYPEFAPPSRLPPEIRIPVTFLFIAHVCLDELRQEGSNTRQTSYLDEYLDLLGWKGHLPAGIVRKALLPSLKKKMDALPSYLRELLEAYDVKGGDGAPAGSGV
ncbi:MAG: HDOD domain-containing protein [Deltaproteobacteria bacterium]|nr:HDOD domain-containing protein [Deltaproteobacteria bacterium]